MAHPLTNKFFVDIGSKNIGLTPPLCEQALVASKNLALPFWNPKYTLDSGLHFYVEFTYFIAVGKQLSNPCLHWKIDVKMIMIT